MKGGGGSRMGGGGGERRRSNMRKGDNRRTSKRDERVSPHSLHEKLPLQDLEDHHSHIPKFGVTKRHLRRLERKRKRKRHRGSANISSGFVHGPQGAAHQRQHHEKEEEKKEEDEEEDEDVHAHERQDRHQRDHQHDLESATPAEMDLRQIRRLERLLKVQKTSKSVEVPKKPSTASKSPASMASRSRYADIFGDEDDDILDLLKACDNTLNKSTKSAAEPHLTSDDDDEVLSENDFASDISSRDDDSTDTSQDFGSDSQHDTQERKEEAPRKSFASASKFKPSRPSATKSMQGLLNRVSESNALQISESIAALFPKQDSLTVQQEWANAYTDAVLHAIGTGNSVGATNPYLRAHVTVAVKLGSLAGVGVLGTFVVETLHRLCASLSAIDSTGDVGSEVDDAVRRSRYCGFLVIVSALYEQGVLSSQFLFELLEWIAEPLSKDRLDAELKFLQEAAPTMRKQDPAAFAELVKFTSMQVQPRKPCNESEVSSNLMTPPTDLLNEITCKMDMVKELVDNVRNNRIKHILAPGLKQAASSTEVSDPLFLVSLSDVLNSKPTSPRWWDANKRDASASATQGDGGAQEKKAVHDQKSPRLSKLATSLRLNTDARRALLSAIVTSANCADAFHRIERLGVFSAKLKLKDAAHIITHCCGAEQPYNPFYALLAKKIAKNSRDARFAVEFSIQDAIKEGDCRDASGNLNRRAANLARFLGDLWAFEALPLSLLRRVTDLDDVASVSYSCYTAAFERMFARRHASSMDIALPFKLLMSDKSSGSVGSIPPLVVLLRRGLRGKVEEDLRPILARIVRDLEKSML